MTHPVRVWDTLGTQAFQYSDGNTEIRGHSIGLMQSSVDRCCRIKYSHEKYTMDQGLDVVQGGKSHPKRLSGQASIK